ncbi:hypothetical protein ACUM5Y_09750 [Marinomonas dokdonensis]|uniref:hypothetical protein n=1 Tax=Marinomonas dokdonensis TaxID=328224 RepID=UPI0040554B15
MLFRCLIGILWMAVLSVPAQADSNEPSTSAIEEKPEALAEKVFELERSLAILQLSTARLSDYQSLAEQVAENRSLQDKVSFLICFVFIMLVALVVVAYQLWNTQKALNKLKDSTEESS